MTGELTPECVEDLRRSGLTDETIKSAGIHLARLDDLGTLATTTATAYAIPYRGTDGHFYNDFQRIRLLPPAKRGEKYLKYVQPKGSSPHVYLPPQLDNNIWTDTTVSLIITEGEKKALRAVQDGFNAIAIGGVDSWRVKQFRIRSENVNVSEKGITVRTDDKHDIRELSDIVCPELHDIEWTGRTVWLIYDTDQREASKANVQRAAFDFAIWLDGKGANVGQVSLPLATDSKMGLDDFLVSLGSDALSKLLAEPLRFPIPPNIKEWVYRKLSGSRVARSVHLEVARGVIASLDSSGSRFHDSVRRHYYFERDARILHELQWNSSEIRQLRLTSMGTLLDLSYGLGTSDAQAISRLADRFASTPPCPEIRPRRVSCTVGDVLYYQLSNSRMAKVSAGEVTLVDNGTDDVLFLSSKQIVPINESLLYNYLSAADVRHRVNGGAVSQLPFHSVYTRSLWSEALRELMLEPMLGLDYEQTVQTLDVLFHLSPWLRRWRGLMLPVELCIAEPNSGKTFLYNLRRGILTGDPSLDNPPNDIRDWYASVASAPGLWVCDNLGELRKDVRDKLSDEMARLTTDPNPSVELREYYTTNTVSRISVDANFAGTAIWNPFNRADILQRAIVYSLREIPPGSRDSSWYVRRLADRERWVASHLLAVHRFFRVAEANWSDNYLSGHRLVNYEQAFLCMSIALGYEPAVTAQLVKNLVSNTQEMIADSEPVFEGLKTFVDEWKTTHEQDDHPRLQDIVNWAHADIDQRYSRLRAFGNVVLLGRHVRAYRHQIERSCGVSFIKVHNVLVMKVLS